MNVCFIFNPFNFILSFALFKMSLDMNDIFSDLDSEMKKGCWKETCDFIALFFQEFMDKLSLAENIQKAGKCIESPFSVLCSTFAKLQNMSQGANDYLTFSNRLCEFFITVDPATIIHVKIREQLANNINSWIGSMLCCELNCAQGCNKICDVNRINHAINTTRKYSWNDFALMDNQPKILANDLFGTILKSCIGILHKLDQSLPSYREIFDRNMNEGVEFLMQNKIPFEIVFRQQLYFTVSNASRMSIEDLQLKYLIAI